MVVDYQALTNPASQYATFNPEVVRGLAHDAEGQRLFTIHAYASSLLVFDASFSPNPNPMPLARWRTLTDPVSVVHHEKYVYVVGQGNHALAKHDPDTGEIVDVVQLGSEPADMVVDDKGFAWISCMASDEVLRVQLAPSLKVVERVSWDEGLRLKRPRFLTHQSATGSTPERILVAPFVSGNGSFGVDRYAAGTNAADGTRELEPTEIYDGYDPQFITSYGYNGYCVLPDEDLFAIELTDAMDVGPVARGVGTLLTAHGQHPKTGDYWMLGIESHNADPNRQSEPALNGEFATNELEVIKGGIPTLASIALPIDLVTPSTTTEVDLLPGGGLDPTGQRALSFPQALAFGEVGGSTIAAVAGSTTPCVALFDSSGARMNGTDLLLDSGLAHGRVPRSLLFVDERLFVYCQETSNVQVWEFSTAAGGQITPGSAPLVDFALGEDPTPPDIAAGRSIWYDASRSLNGRVSCNTCHPAGETDALSWPLTHDTLDFKDPMVTQSLDGALDAYPLHWRGERDLVDFNEAFDGLLGGDLSDRPAEGPGGEFEQFKAFVFALQPTANPKQPLDRRLRADSAPYEQLPGFVGDPALGHQMFIGVEGIHTGGTSDPNILVQVNCNRCHAMPTGSIGAPINDNAVPLANDGSGDPNFVHSDLAWNGDIETAALHNMGTIRNQPLVEFQHMKSDSSIARYDLPILGFGYLHSGVTPSQPDFLLDNFLTRANPINDDDRQDAAHLAAFLDLFDSGTAPSVHSVFRFQGGSASAGVLADIAGLLIGQASSGWVDVAVLGTPTGGGSALRESWWYDPSVAKFVSDDPAQQPRVLGDFAAQFGWDYVFLGCLPGQGERLGVDFDDDDLVNGDDSQAGLDPWDGDFDNDGFPDGYETTVTGLDPIAYNVASDNDDAVPPSLVSWIPQPVLDFASARAAKFEFEADEPVRWVLTATSTGGDTLESHSETFARRHNAVLRNLLPSDSAGTGWLNSYSVQLDLIDLRGLVSSYPISGSVDAGRNPSGETIVVEDAALTASSFGGGVRIAKFSMQLADLGEQNRVARPGLVPVVHVLRRDSPLDEWEFVPAADLLPSSADYISSTLEMQIGTAQRIWDPTSHMTQEVSPGVLVAASYLVLPQTNAAGDSSAVLSIANAAKSTEFAVQVVQVFEPFDPASYDPNAAGFVPVFKFATRHMYNMPLTHRDARMVEMQ